MAKANVILQNSILWNLREVTKLAEKIKKRCGDVDCLSWRYPTTSCSELEIFKLLQNNRNLDNYTYVLELTYDRLLYVLNLMIKYMESHDSLEKFRPKRNVYRPRMLSLATILHMMWDRIQAQWETANEVKSLEKLDASDNGSAFNTSVNVTKSSTCTQSEVSSISLCSCCEMVQHFVTQLVLDMENIVETQSFDSALMQERNTLKEYLMDMTSWSAMSRWLTAILKDFGTLAEKAEQATVCSRKLKSRLENGEQNLKTKLEQHIEETRKLEIRIRDYESKNALMKKDIDELMREKKQLNEEIKLKNLEIATNSLNSESRITELRKNYEKQLKEKKKEKSKREKKKEEELKNKLECKSKKLEELRGKFEELEKTISQLRKEVDELSLRSAEEKENLLRRSQDLEKELARAREEKSELKKALEEKQKVIEDYSARLMETYPDLNDNCKPSYKASGVPEIDMANQMEANKLRMEHLKAENEKLQKTLDKIISLKG